MTCSCPYAERGEACKHMAAVLYQVDDEQDEQDEQDGDGEDCDEPDLDREVVSI